MGISGLLNNELVIVGGFRYWVSFRVKGIFGEFGPYLSQNLQRLDSYSRTFSINLLGLQLLLNRSPDRFHLGQGLAGVILTPLPDASRLLIRRCSSQFDNLFGLLLGFCFYGFGVGIGFLPRSGCLLLDTLRVILGLGYYGFGVSVGCLFNRGGMLLRLFRLLLSLRLDCFSISVGFL